MVLPPSHLALCTVAMGFGSRERLFGHWVNSILIMYAQSMRVPKQGYIAAC